MPRFIAEDDPDRSDRITWAQILAHWRLIEADLHERYQVDVADQALMQSRTWHWLRIRIMGLLDLPPTWMPDGRPVSATRFGLAVVPIPPPQKSPTT